MLAPGRTDEKRGFIEGALPSAMGSLDKDLGIGGSTGMSA
jgi:hypothetical protein